MLKITASIVLYNEKHSTLKRVIKSFLNINLPKELIVIDNSQSDDLRELCEEFENLTYIKTKKNIGFGAGHNFAFKNLTMVSNIHLVINPDTYFESQKLKEYIEWFFLAKEISLTTPRVCYPDGSVQNITRNIPTPLSLIKRRLHIYYDEFVVKENSIEEIPFAHGCFMLFKTEIFKKLDGFDERFFLYMEDTDIFIRAKEFGKTVMNSNFLIYHEYTKGSSKSLKLLFWHMSSAIKFFGKYR